MHTLNLELRPITLNEYQTLRATTNWGAINPDNVQASLDNSILSVVVTCDEETVGIGRVIGDGGIYFYVQDIIVKPAFRKLGVGKMIMAEIMLFLEQNAPENAFIGLMASKGVQPFYNQFGFEKRPEERPGMYIKR